MQSRALTLVELLVVLAIIAVVSGVVVPNLRGSLKGMRVRDAALTFADYLRYSQMLAVERERPVRVVIDRAHHGYCVEMATSLTGLEFQPVMSLSPKGFVGLPEGVDFDKIVCAVAPDGKKDVLWFEPSGIWSSGRVWVSDGDRTVQVRIGHAIGCVDVQDVQEGSSNSQEPEYADLLASPM